MTEHVYVTETGERVRERNGLVEVGLSFEAQAALGHLLHFQPLKIGEWVEKDSRLFVVEGKLAAAEFYAPVSGHISACAGPDARISNWLVKIQKQQRTLK